MKRPRMIIGAMLMLAVCAVAGCLSPEQIQQTRDGVQKLHDATTQQVADQQAIIAQQQAAIDQQRAIASTMPSDEPARKQLEQAVTVAQKAVDAEQKAVATEVSFIEKANARMAQLDAALAAAQSGNPTALISALGAIPGIGQYAVLVGLLAAPIIAAVKNGQAQKTAVAFRDAFGDVVTSVEAAFPNKTAEQKAALATIQSQKTKALVEAIKSS